MVGVQNYVRFRNLKFIEKTSNQNPCFFNINSTATAGNPRTKLTMVRTRGAKYVPKQRSKTIYDMHCICVRVKDIAQHCEMKQPTVRPVQRKIRCEPKL